MEPFRQISLALVAVASLVMMPASGYAQEEQKKDNTGTNPINFSKDFRVY